VLITLADHLWQSVLFCALIAFFAVFTRAHFAALRLWLWRIAALKFVFPFAVLFALGELLGFPVPNTADPPPPLFVTWLRESTPLVAPARAFEATGAGEVIALLLALGGAGVCARVIEVHLREEGRRVRDEAARLDRDVNDVVPAPGFLPSALLTACALSAVSVPVLAGAIADLQHRRELLVINSLSFRSARISITAAAPGMGTRYRVTADPDGVFIRNATIRELVALVYGVNSYYVRGDHFYESGEQDWLLVPRYDIRVVGPVREPERFDPYALRQAVTKTLAARFSFEIYLNDSCQPPCGKYHVDMSQEPL
jgi:hypothetical protein